MHDHSITKHDIKCVLEEKPLLQFGHKLSIIIYLSLIPIAISSLNLSIKIREKLCQNIQ